MQRYECYADYVELDGMVVAQYQWDFDHIWTLDKKVNDGFPSLRFVETETDIVLKETLHSPNVNLIEIEFSISKSVKGGLILAGYDDAGRLVAVNNTNCITSETYTDGSRYKLYYDKEPEVVKVMVWETDGSMKPACAALEFHVDGVPINIPQ